ncbi:hypothetical protein FNV43_RR16776 [Rhamnella rubrinervis]|uniref:Uncharacterized protein n=1 Tax=Rhamnella rubrinervis TaxID=2594499 RepID=A0A8K0GZI0_9ROSA|nr:hypothetical protein FNV43_RR16776 [Rhamnella rubrinervis]
MYLKEYRIYESGPAIEDLKGEAHLWASALRWDHTPLFWYFAYGLCTNIVMYCGRMPRLVLCTMVTYLGVCDVCMLGLCTSTGVDSSCVKEVEYKDEYIKTTYTDDTGEGYFTPNVEKDSKGVEGDLTQYIMIMESMKKRLRKIRKSRVGEKRSNNGSLVQLPHLDGPTVQTLEGLSPSLFVPIPPELSYLIRDKDGIHGDEATNLLITVALRDQGPEKKNIRINVESKESNKAKIKGLKDTVVQLEENSSKALQDLDNLKSSINRTIETEVA